MATMQVMWSRAPLGRMHCIAVRVRSALVIIAAVAAALVAAGSAGSFAALRLAFDYDPGLAASLGGVLTVRQAEQRESVYRSKLEALRAELAAVREQLGRLDALKEEVAKTISPVRGRGSRPQAREGAGRGGPHISLDGGEQTGVPLGMTAELETARAEVGQVKAELERAHGAWRRALVSLHRTPLLAPLADMSGLTSRYGARIDPFTQTPARHEGIDVAAPAGTPILATGSGVVARVVRDPQYGNMVDVDHGNGYLTRYAHARSIRVKAGETVERGAVLGTVGSTGRSTAPHLHYEVRFENRPQNPLAYVPRSN